MDARARSDGISSHALNLSCALAYNTTFQLLLKILETSEISANVAKISETWPATEEAPTPRAIQERLHRIRAMAGGKGSGTFKMSGTVGSRNGPNSAKSSPAKPTTPKKNKVKAPGSKRKRASEDDDEPNELEPGIKAEIYRFDIGSESPTSAKKPKTKAAGSQDYGPANGIKEEPSQQMDGVFDAHFTMPGEI
ncbi:MAG: hypothetical protein L6R38_004750 [Xanthoria sp. 2 TBL-2021]|nr:MAG: hypothetical protein L6R38_004750 [Xanthoria sp. 2 TBL-2021]